MTLPPPIPIVIAIHGIPLGPLAHGAREQELHRQAKLREEWMFATSHQNLRVFRASPEKP